MITRSHVFTAVLLAALAASCGGKKAPDTMPSGGGEGEGGGTAARSDPGGGDVVQPDTMDEIQRRFQRKGTAVSRCVSAAVDAKELPKNSRGKMTLNVVIAPSGKASEVTVAKTSLESKLLAECVIAKVKEIVFPEVPEPFPTSFTYGFESM